MGKERIQRLDQFVRPDEVDSRPPGTELGTGEIGASTCPSTIHPVASVSLGVRSTRNAGKLHDDGIMGRTTGSCPMGRWGNHREGITDGRKGKKIRGRSLGGRRGREVDDTGTRNGGSGGEACTTGEATQPEVAMTRANPRKYRHRGK